MLTLSAVLVHYRTPELAARAVEALAKDARESELELELLLVDNGSDDAGRELLRGLPAHYLDAGGNRGYAGGANVGLAAAKGEALVVMNPDVVVFPGCLASLAVTLMNGADVVGPRFYWDDDRVFLLPPTEERTLAAELLAVLARRGGRWAHAGRRRWRRHAHRHWRASVPFPSHALSGAMLAFRRDAWERIGRFDEKYRLYFEETDWLERARRLGLECRHVPAAEAVHLYAQSTLVEPRAEAWFEASARRFRRHRYGALGRVLIETFARVVGGRELDAETASAADPSSAGPPSSAQPDEIPVLPADDSLWLEVAASSAGYPAAARLLPAGAGVEILTESSLPEEVWSRLPAGRYLLRLVDGEREIASRVISKGL